MVPKSKGFAAVTATLVILALPAWADFSYNYVELQGDLSRTDNTARGAIGDADGSLFGVEAAFEVTDSLYLKGGISVEDKSFRNEIAGVMSNPNGPPLSFDFGEIDLDTRQFFLSLGAGYRLAVSDSTDVFGELMVKYTEVDHDLPCVEGLEPGKCLRVSELGGFFRNLRGPPPRGATVAKIPGLLTDTGYGLRFGLRHGFVERFEIEASLGFVDIVNEQETSASVGLRHLIQDNAAIGVSFTLAQSTDANFDNIRKIGISLRIMN